jgi:hypothetical protein
MGDAVLALVLVLGFAIVVAELRHLRKRQLRLLKETARLARQREADEFSRFCYPHLYPRFQSELRVRYWDRQIRGQLHAVPAPLFKAMKRWEGNSFEATIYRSLWKSIHDYEEEARAHTDLSDLEIEFLWQHRLSYSRLLAEDALKDDHIPTQVSVKSFAKELQHELDSFRRRDREPA